MAVTIWSDKVLRGPTVGKAMIDNVIEEEVEADETHPVESKKLDSNVSTSNHQHVDELEEEKKKKEEVVTTLPKPPSPFPHRLKKKADDTRFIQFMAMLKQLMVNMPLVEALEKMPGYAKFIKDLVTKKRIVSYELVDNLYHCGAILTRSMVQKKVDPGAFTIPFTIASLDFVKALCEVGESINLVLLAVNKKLGLGDPTPTNMRLVMADMSVKRPVVLYDVLVKVASFIFPVDFFIVDFEVPIILGRPFLATGSILIDL
ncbi:uncharacterized protein LOC124897818 [Capsicum annuum]|uniref:uncharacterized protein LOC124897817 n=1 Tax=Capsicum annuum TaxID=4072 RepID=UPI001FB06953|nr:uncharacterized protein LOC124897817 [Capsicum annuum]XP_047267318.1 uncharacterized protein LOC124897818 [Capsicum annuum]